MPPAASESCSAKTELQSFASPLRSAITGTDSGARQRHRAAGTASSQSTRVSVFVLTQRRKPIPVYPLIDSTGSAARDHAAFEPAITRVTLMPAITTAPTLPWNYIAKLVCIGDSGLSTSIPRRGSDHGRCLTVCRNGQVELDGPAV